MTDDRKYSLLFLGKADDPDCQRALEYCAQAFGAITHCLGRWGEPLPESARNWKGDYIISYLSRWVIPSEVLGQAGMAAVNFHPASPDYPGIGCNNFALYENATEYGATCHHMAPQVDTGPIIAVRRFPVLPEDDVASLLKRTYENQFTLFMEVSPLMAQGRTLPSSTEKWTRPPFTRREFNELFRITPEMDRAEIARRVRAVSFGRFQPYIELEGYRFEYAPPRP
jgi:methionyl-tRNA formyltransferase